MAPDLIPYAGAFTVIYAHIEGEIDIHTLSTHQIFGQIFGQVFWTRK